MANIVGFCLFFHFAPPSWRSSNFLLLTVTPTQSRQSRLLRRRTPGARSRGCGKPGR
jgi:hypothetical protein